MTHKMKLRNIYFNKIKSGQKRIEIRLYDEKRRKIKENDIIEFTNIETNELLNAKVLKIHLFKTFKELFDFFDKRLLGYDINDIIEYQMMYDFYTKEEEQKYGVVGIEIMLIKGDK